MTTDKLNIRNELAQLDRKNRNFYDSLDDEEKKKFSPYLMIRWAASITGDFNTQAYYLCMTNENLNKHFFDISTKDHKKFQWLLASTISPGAGIQNYKWLAAKKKETGNNKAEKFLRELYPLAKADDVILMAKLNTTADLKELARKHGWTDKQVKEYL
jgi:hypothetical protein